MERSLHSTISHLRKVISALLVALFYAVGFFGFISPEYKSLFSFLIPFHLLLMLLLTIIGQDDKNGYFWAFLIVTFIAGFLIELIGVQTGVIFGNYTYGPSLGAKLVDIPLIIGVNWILVIYSTGSLLQYLPVKNLSIKALIGALLVTLLDFFIEPVAIKYDYWQWTDGKVPFQNYVGWYVFSFAMLLFLFLMHFSKRNPVAVVLFAAQFLFFLALNLIAV